MWLESIFYLSAEFSLFLETIILACKTSNWTLLSLTTLFLSFVISSPFIYPLHISAPQTANTQHSVPKPLNPPPNLTYMFFMGLTLPTSWEFTNLNIQYIILLQYHILPLLHSGYFHWKADKCLQFNSYNPQAIIFPSNLLLILSPQTTNPSF